MIISVMIVIASIITPQWQQKSNNHYPGGGIARAHLWKEQRGAGSRGEVFRSLSSIQWRIQLLVSYKKIIINIVEGTTPSFVFLHKNFDHRYSGGSASQLCLLTLKCDHYYQCSGGYASQLCPNFETSYTAEAYYHRYIRTYAYQFCLHFHIDSFPQSQN